MHNFCTLFDSKYLTRGLALHESLERSGVDFHLYAFAFDEESDRILRAIRRPHLTVVSLAEFEDEKLRRVKKTRSPMEYCWTCTPSIILHVLERFGADRCTYLDADLWFYANPSVLLAEMGDNSVLITEHRYTPRYDKSRKSGKYCVQFISFRKDDHGLEALRWWRDRCNEWCYARLEDGKFGDQMYLNDWTTRFRGVHVLQHRGGGVAPWNVQQYSLKPSGSGFLLTENASGRESELIFYHFHYVRFFTNGLVDLGRRALSKQVLEYLYKPYLRKLEQIRIHIRAMGFPVDPHGAGEWTVTWKSPVLYAWRTLNGTYHVYDMNKFL